MILHEHNRYQGGAEVVLPAPQSRQYCRPYQSSFPSLGNVSIVSPTTKMMPFLSNTWLTMDEVDSWYCNKFEELLWKVFWYDCNNKIDSVVSCEGSRRNQNMLVEVVRSNHCHKFETNNINPNFIIHPSSTKTHHTHNILLKRHYPYKAIFQWTITKKIPI